MRVLAGSTGGAGHLGPMMPFLRGCRAAGADVLLAAPESVRTSEVDFTPLPDTPPEVLGPIYGSLPSLPREEANARVMREVFGGANVDATLATWESLISSWQPDLVLREVAEVGSYVAASRAGVPFVSVALGLRALDGFMADCVEESLPERYGAGAAPLRTARTVSLMPPSMDTGAPPTEYFRDPSMTASDGALPDGVPDDERPLVYVTFGSVAASVPHFAGVYRGALDALADAPVRVLMTLGREGDPGSLGAVPPNAFVTRWAPQPAVLRHASVAVGHGGFGTTYGALAAGVPVVVLPLFSSDQFANAAAVADHGAGLAVSSPDEIAGAVTRLLDDDAVRAKATGVAGELAALPDATGWAP